MHNCHYWFFNHRFKFQDHVCNDCHDVTMLCLNITDITIIITFKNVLNLIQDIFLFKIFKIQDIFFLLFLFNIYKMVIFCLIYIKWFFTFIV